MNANLISGMVAQLVAEGWKAEDGTAIASKTYATAVGPKQAHAYVQDFGPTSENVVLAGDYQSEGRNILEPHGVLVPRSAEGGVLSALVQKFVRDADDTVADSYAARLLKPKLVDANN